MDAPVKKNRSRRTVDRSQKSATSTPEAVPAKQPHSVHADRWSDGTCRPGNPGPALLHGAYSLMARPPDLEALAGDLQAWRDQLLIDQGGDDISTVRRAYVDKLTQTEGMVRLLWRNLSTGGLFTAGGRTRAALNAYLRVVARWDQLAMRLGIERRAKPVTTMTPLEWMESIRDDPEEKPQ